MKILATILDGFFFDSLTDAKMIHFAITETEKKNPAHEINNFQFL